MATEIELHFSRQHFEEIYFKNFQGDYFRSPTTKVSFRILVALVALFVVLFIYSVWDNSYGLLVLCGFIMMVAGFTYLWAVRLLYKWKKNIYDYLALQEKYTSHRVVLSADYLSLIQDGKETIEKWSNFTSIKITDEYIGLEGKEGFIFPQKSMAAEQYNVFRKIVSEKFKQ